MKFPPSLLDDIRARLPVSQVVARKVALKRAGREFRGLSPFKTEKTPSFYVNDQKGFYHCFASGEHGDIFKFVMTTEGLSFPETVERLAEEAGVPMPKPDAKTAQREDQRVRLQGLLEASARHFEENLKGAAGSEARRYLAGRGLTHETIRRFRIGYALPGRHVLQAHLATLGYTVDEMILSGMLIGGEDIKQPYDRFRHRVIFPITDLKDRAIAFGGRALEKDERAKYLNSPETPLFHKGAVLFNAAKARAVAHETERLIIVEGYMDVVSLSAAGFGDSVAPLGTALTEDQMTLVWRLVHEPILCFDGDSAGKKAAHRAVDTILPHLKPGYSAGFAFLPDGLDPDDLVRQEGPEAMQGVLARALPLAQVLWDREFSSGDWSTPERRARLQQQVAQLVDRIGDPSVRAHYAAAMRERLNAAFAPAGRPAQSTRQGPAPAGRTVQAAARDAYRIPTQARPGARPPAGPGRAWGRPDWAMPPPTASASLRQSGLVGAEAGHPPYREALMIMCLINHPWLVEADLERIAAIEFTSGAVTRLRDALVASASSDKTLDSAEVRSQLGVSGLSKVVDLCERAITHKSDRFAGPEADAVEADTGWRHTLALHERQSMLRKALAAAERDLNAEGSEDAWSRIVEIKKLLASTEDLKLPSGS
jgi:DNA primase